MVSLSQRAVSSCRGRFEPLPLLAIVMLAISSCTGWMPGPFPMQRDGDLDSTIVVDSDEATRPDGDSGSDGDADTDADNDADFDEDDTRDADVEIDFDEDEPEPVAFGFAITGDNQFATSNCTSGTSERRAVPVLISELDVDFVLHVGDLMDHGYEAGAYEHYEDCWSATLSVLPFFPTVGNHDCGRGAINDYKVYLERQLFVTNPAVYGGDYDTDFAIAYEDDPTEYSTDFDDPSDRSVVPSGVSWETFYAFRFANSYFISMEQGTRWWANTPKTWLEDHLERASSDSTIDHIFVYLHHPLYSSTMAETSDGECVGPVRRHYEEFFQSYDVTIVFSGHAHLYDHHYVPDDGAPTRDRGDTTYPNDGDAVQYIVTGGAGGGLNPCNPIDRGHVGESWDFYQNRVCAHHVTEVRVDDHRVTVRVHTVEGDHDDYRTEIFDELVLE